MSPDSSICCVEGVRWAQEMGREVLGKRCMQGRPVGGGWDGEAPPLIISVDLGGGNWLEQVIGAAGMVVGWDAMGWSGSCRRGSGAGSLEVDVWSCDSRLMVIWRAAMS